MSKEKDLKEQRRKKMSLILDTFIDRLADWEISHRGKSDDVICEEKDAIYGLTITALEALITDKVEKRTSMCLCPACNSSSQCLLIKRNEELEALMPNGVWVCNNCGAIKEKEEEVTCWKCGKGEMVYREAPIPKECSLKDIINYSCDITQLSGFDINDPMWSHSQGNNPFWCHLATAIWMKMTGRNARGYDGWKELVKPLMPKEEKLEIKVDPNQWKNFFSWVMENQVMFGDGILDWWKARGMVDFLDWAKVVKKEVFVNIPKPQEVSVEEMEKIAYDWWCGKDYKECAKNVAQALHDRIYGGGK